MFDKEKIARLLAEFLGTAALVLVLLSVLGRTSFPFFTALGAGLAAGLMYLLVGRVSGGHFNPAITLGLWTRKLIPTYDTIAYIAAQFLAAISAMSLYQYLVNDTISSAAQAFDWRIFTAEAAGGLAFGFGFVAIASSKQNSGTAASAIGVSLVVGMLIASIASAGLVNPAVALGADSLSRAYIFGPIVGAVIGMNLYAMAFEQTNRKKSRAKNKFLAIFFRR
jgi:aquaporin Z